MENPEFFQGGYCNPQMTPEKRLSDAKNGDHFIVEDLLDFPNEDGMGTDVPFEVVMTGNSTESSTVTAVDISCNSSFAERMAETHLTGDNIGGCRTFPDGQFSSELCVPKRLLLQLENKTETQNDKIINSCLYDDLAELEWLSNFVEESFSSEDLQKLQLIQGMKAPTDEVSGTHQYQFHPETTRNARILRPEMSVPAKARSKRSRTAPGNWTSRLSVVSPNSPAAISSSSESDIVSSSGKKLVKVPQKKEGSDNAATPNGGEGRKCLHCATDKTPQWRTGPMGPKTLCNACGVRYKSGRLVPEYRPAASPTFVLTKHSNSHRKVLELRRQKEMVRAQQNQQQQQFLHPNMMFDLSNGEDYLIHQHIGPDFRQLI